VLNSLVEDGEEDRWKALFDGVGVPEANILPRNVLKKGKEEAEKTSTYQARSAWMFQKNE